MNRLVFYDGVPMILSMVLQAFITSWTATL